MIDAIYELLTAERRGRAIALLQNPSPGSTWRIGAKDDRDGHAFLAASRWGKRLGADVSISAAYPERPSHIWSTLWESCRKQGLVEDSSLSYSVGENRLISHNPHGDKYVLYPSEMPGENAAWGYTLGQSSLFVREADTSLPVLTCAECRLVDKRASELFGVPGVCLMENAALGLLAVAMDMLHGRRRTVLLLAGGGNNGGDALAMARGLWTVGLPCEVALVKPEESLKGDAAVNLLLLLRTGVTVHRLADQPEGLPPLLEQAGLIVDGLLGTGFAGGLSPDYGRIIGHVNAARKPVLGIDIPSGLNGDTGKTDGAAVLCERTVTFAAMKTGLTREKGPMLAGRIYLADIGAPGEAYRRSE